ncbi:ATP dependent DNA ligase [Actinokineospora sp. NPDC004072]
MSPHYLDVTGTDMLDIAAASQLEGIVAKRPDSRYEPGRRSRAWTKTALRLTQEVVIGGWTPGEGRRARGLGGLLLGVHDQADGRLRYVGNVGTGFTQRALDDLQNLLHELARDSSPFDDLVPTLYARRARWVQPRLVGKVEHRAWTSDNRLRHPSWRGLRPDRRSTDISAAFQHT